MSEQPPSVPYDRDVLVEVVIFHHKPRIEGCACGWAELGKDHGQHVADVYEASALARQNAPSCQLGPDGRCTRPDHRHDLTATEAVTPSADERQS